jgi:hypothetical protein
VPRTWEDLLPKPGPNARPWPHNPGQPLCAKENCQEPFPCSHHLRTDAGRTADGKPLQLEDEGSLLLEEDEMWMHCGVCRGPVFDRFGQRIEGLGSLLPGGGVARCGPCQAAYEEAHPDEEPGGLYPTGDEEEDDAE